MDRRNGIASLGEDDHCGSVALDVVSCDERAAVVQCEGIVGAQWIVLYKGWGRDQPRRCQIESSENAQDRTHCYTTKKTKRPRAPQSANIYLSYM